jgi:hypothetical protein
MEVDWFLATASMLHTLPMTGNLFRSMPRLKSGLITVQESPRSLLLKILLAAKYKRLLSKAEINMGESQFQRQAASPCFSMGLMDTCSPDFLSKRIKPPYCHWL